jgi:hypothetical protein
VDADAGKVSSHTGANSQPSSSSPKQVWSGPDDARRDGWESEVHSAQAKHQLEVLGALVAQPDSIDPKQLAALAIDEFRCDRIRPDALETVFKDPFIHVERNLARAAGASFGETYQGRHGLQQALIELAASFSGGEKVRYEFKPFSIHETLGGFTTRQLVSFAARLPAGVLEQHAVWEVEWEHDSAGNPPRMRSIQVEQFEQTH